MCWHWEELEQLIPTHGLCTGAICRAELPPTACRKLSFWVFHPPFQVGWDSLTLIAPLPHNVKIFKLLHKYLEENSFLNLWRKKKIRVGNVTKWVWLSALPCCCYCSGGISLKTTPKPPAQSHKNIYYSCTNMTQATFKNNTPHLRSKSQIQIRFTCSKESPKKKLNRAAHLGSDSNISIK